MIDVDHDAEPARAVGIQSAADVERLAKRVHAGAVGGVHRMKRLDRERNTGAVRMIQERFDSVLDLLPCFRDIL